MNRVTMTLAGLTILALFGLSAYMRHQAIFYVNEGRVIPDHVLTLFAISSTWSHFWPLGMFAIVAAYWGIGILWEEFSDRKS